MFWPLRSEALLSWQVSPETWLAEISFARGGGRPLLARCFNRIGIDRLPWPSIRGLPIESAMRAERPCLPPVTASRPQLSVEEECDIRILPEGEASLDL